MSGDDVAKLGLEVTTAGYDEAIQKNKDLASATKSAADTADAAKDKFVGLGSSATGLGGTFTQTAATATRINDAFAAMRTGVSAVNKPLVDNGQAATAMGAAINAAIARSSTSFDDLKKGVSLANAEIKGANAVIKDGIAPAVEAAAAHEHFSTQAQSLFHALRGAAEQIALGVSPTQALTAQMNHLSYAASGEGGLTGAFSQISSKVGGAIETVGRFITPLTVAGTAMAAFSAGAIAAAIEWQSSQNDIQKALVGIGRQSGITATDINAIGVATSATTKLSIGQATELATAFAATGRVSKEVVGPATQATEGLAKALGVDSADAAKLFAAALADPAKGVAELDAKVGAFNSTTREQIAQAVRVGDTGTAQALIIRGVVVATQDAIKANESWADSFSDVWKSIKNGANLVGKDVVQGAQNYAHDIGGAPPSAGVSKQEQLAVAKTDLSNATAALPAKLADAGGDASAIEGVYNIYGKLVTRVNDLKQALASQDIAAWNAQLNSMADLADKAAAAMVPQTAQIKQLESAIINLKRAQEVADVSGNQANSGDNAAALVAAENQLKILQESKDEAAAYNLNVQAIAAAYDGVSTKTALQLNQLEQQLPVAQAVTAEAKMLAQSGVDYQQTLLLTGNELSAAAVAADKLALSQAAATSSVEKQVSSLKDSTDMIRAQQNGTEAVTAAGIAYKNAIAAGASDTAASALSAATLANYAAKAAASTQQMAEASAATNNALEQAARAMQGINLGAGGDFGSFDVPKGTQYTSTNPISNAWIPNVGNVSTSDYKAYLAGTLIIDPHAPHDHLVPRPSTPNPSSTDIANAVLAGGGIDAAIKGAESVPTPDFSAISSLFDIKNTRTSDSSAKAANLREEMAWLQTQPETIARDQSIVNLQQSIDALNNSTGTLNGTMQDALSPFYTQDPRTSHIGFRSQGMATGGEFTVPGGVSMNDNMIGQIPLASGEIVSVRRPGESSGSVNITNHITVGPGVNKDAIGRTVYQATQNAIRQQRATAQ